LKLVGKVDALAAVYPQPADLVIKVMAPDEDYWPLPWYLRRFHHTGWWSGIPADPLAPLMIASANLHANLDEKGTHLMVGYFQLRPDAFFELYVEKQLWTAWLAKAPHRTVHLGIRWRRSVPFFRIFTPINQGQNSTRTATMFRQWPPELAKLPNPWIHQPRLAPPEILDRAGVRMDKDYPRPYRQTHHRSRSSPGSLLQTGLTHSRAWLSPPASSGALLLH